MPHELLSVQSKSPAVFGVSKQKLAVEVVLGRDKPVWSYKLSCVLTRKPFHEFGRNSLIAFLNHFLNLARQSWDLSEA